MISQETVGEPAALRAAGEWAGGIAQAIVLLRRPDAVKAEIDRRGTPLASLLGLPEALRRAPEGPGAHLPPRMLLLLDSACALRLFEAEREVELRLGEEVASWRAGTVKMTVQPGRGRFRPVEIAYGGEQLVVAAPWRGGAQAALRLIEERTGFARAPVF